jgi:threonylcarbamoyladenosine tRNA methylthiotransferase MtaB
MAGKYRLSTLGCKVNQYESQQIRELLESFGLQPAVGAEPASIAVVNTCAVTSNALRKSRQEVRKLARDGVAVIVVGCGVAADRDSLGRLPGTVASIDHSADLRAALAPYVQAILEETPSRSIRETMTDCRSTGSVAADEAHGASFRPPDEVRVWAGRPDAQSTHNIVGMPLPVVNAGNVLPDRIERFDGHQRAFLKVQDGCDAHCTYCIIPNLRKNLAWKPIEAAVDEARALVRSGHKEIVVTGIFLGAYGRDTAIRRRQTETDTRLADLVAALAAVEGLERLRLSSLEPGDVDRALLDVMAESENCVPHLHLPLQSGSGEILRRMNRQYSIEAFLEMIQRVRSALDRPAITTDIIVGFPGETDADFEASLEVARFAEFAKIHAFPFSPRDGTAAAKWTSQYVHGSAVRDRKRVLAQVENECSLRFRQRALGSIERVLTEGHLAAPDGEMTGLKTAFGRSDRFFQVHFDSPGRAEKGELAFVQIDRVTARRTYGSRVPNGHGNLRLPVLSTSIEAPARPAC